MSLEFLLACGIDPDDAAGDSGATALHAMPPLELMLTTFTLSSNMEPVSMQLQLLRLVYGYGKLVWGWVL